MSKTHPGAAEPRRSSPRAVAAAALVGSALEWYDYFLYGAAASLVFNKIIFPTEHELLGTLAAFATLALGFLVRPLGGVYFGALGDRVGRKKVLVITLLLMGGATTLIGAVPSYETAGFWAPVMLIVLRLAQGFGAGAEFGGAAVFSAENAPPNRRGLFGSFPGVGVYIGLLLASGVFALLTQMPEDQFLSWGWRLPFFASILMIAVALFVRLRIDETPAFQELRSQDAVSTSPLKDLLREQRKPVLIVMGSQVAQSGVSYIYQTFVVTYIAGALAMSSSVGPVGVACAAGVAVVTTPLFGALTDRVGRKPVYLFGAGFSALFAFPFFALVNTRSEGLVILAMVLGIGVGIAAMLGAQGAFFSELFASRVRLSGLVFGREISAAIFGGFAPLVAVAISAAADDATWPVALLAISLSAVTFISLLYAPETRHIDINATTTGEAASKTNTPAGIGG
ncbi:MHS family MFS transporter [Streptomyces sp. NBC_01511]|uniref:MFS transporter n=1 Tax=Streptomyces sp. NBC_01511 TaxID=2903889 RepID=UPI00386AA566